MRSIKETLEAAARRQHTGALLTPDDCRALVAYIKAAEDLASYRDAVFCSDPKTGAFTAYDAAFRGLNVREAAPEED